MKIVLSVDMEGLSLLTDPYEILSVRPEYWAHGKRAMEAETIAACEGLLAAGASEVIVLDNHGSGNPLNVSQECLPAGARLEAWNVFDLPAQGVEAMLQIGYHARGGTDGFISHTYVPGLRLRAGGELISESHGRAWAAGVPLIGIAGNDTHRETLGSLAGVPFLTVQRSAGRRHAERVFRDDAEALDAVRSFASTCLRGIDDAPRPAAPASLFEASMPNGDQQEAALTAAGWTRSGDVEYAVELADWSQAREPLATAMAAAMAPLLTTWVGATSPAERDDLANDRVAALSRVLLDEWCSGAFPQWFTEPATEIRAP